MIFSVLALETINTSNAVTGSLMLTGNAEYAVQALDLGITARKRSTLGGASPYVDVPVTMTMHVFGSTAAICAAAMERLVTTIAQARRWVNRESVDGVRLRMRLNGGTADYTCMLLGPEDGAPPTTYQIEEVVINGVNLFAVLNVELTFWRRGLLYKTVAETATSAAVAQHVAGTCTFASSAAIPTPTDVVWASSSAANMGTGKGYTIIASGIQSVNAKDYTRGTAGMSVVADAAANRSVSGSVARFPSAGGDIDVPISAVTWGAVAVFATVRASSAADTWSARTYLQRGTSATEYAYATIEQSTVPQVILLGIFQSQYGFDTQIVVDIEDVTANTGTIDMDTIHLVQVDLPASIIAAHYNSASVGLRRSSTRSAAIRPRDRDGVSPELIALVTPGGTFAYAYSYNGDIFATSSGTALKFLMLDGGSGTAWREGGAGPSYTPYTDTATATRYPVALTPQ